jgi:hypothetical protein
VKVAAFVVAEARRDARVVQSLVQRVAHEKHGEDVAVELVGPSVGYPPCFVVWRDLPKVMKDHKVKPWHGHFGGKPRAPDGGAAANALLLARAWLKRTGTQANLVVLQRDMDKQPERASGLAQARDEGIIEASKVVLGVARPKVEAWALCAAVIDPEDSELQQRLDDVRAELGSDPRAISHELDASDETAKRSAKRVLEALLGEGDPAYEPLCTTTPMKELHERGRDNGLAMFLKDLAAAL